MLNLSNFAKLVKPVKLANVICAEPRYISQVNLRQVNFGD